MVTKDGIRTFTRFVAEEVRDSNICVISFSPRVPIATETAPETALRDDLVSALLNLGYQRSQVDKAVREALKNVTNPSFESALKGALRRFSS